MLYVINICMDIYYIIYKITNNVNGKIYIGAHKTSNIDDGYMGSGTMIKRAYKKYGMENFTKEILHTYDNKNLMYEMEKTLVNETFIKCDDNYNIKLGGYGGFDYIDNSGDNHPMKKYPELRENLSKKSRDVAINRMRNDPEFKNILSERLVCARQKAQENNPNGTFYNKKHSEGTKIIMSNKASMRIGDQNGSFGTCWVHNNKNNKKIKKSELEEYLTLGWIKGRKMKF